MDDDDEYIHITTLGIMLLKGIIPFNDTQQETNTMPTNEDRLTELENTIPANNLSWHVDRLAEIEKMEPSAERIRLAEEAEKAFEACVAWFLEASKVYRLIGLEQFPPSFKLSDHRIAPLCNQYAERLRAIRREHLRVIRS